MDSNHTEEYQIVLSPELGISANDFLTSWNEDAETRHLSEAQAVSPGGRTFDPTLIAGILITVGSGVATNVISALIMKVLDKKGVSKHTHIEQMKKSDGTQMLVVDIDEK
ncbi:MAG TPA: hypothetical protein VJ761_08145 [Ktedonobacteraceae bacterium]|nr:hypothetical protein [Ktedonobacteraceae bacterium]